MNSKKAIWNEIESVESKCESFIDLLAYDFVTACNQRTNKQCLKKPFTYGLLPLHVHLAGTAEFFLTFDTFPSITESIF